MLVDSGADYTLIAQSDASLLGIDYQKIKSVEMKVEVANLAVIHAKKTEIQLRIDTIELEIPILIAKEEVECLLGRKGFFYRFNILFQEQKNKVVLTT